MSTKVISRGKSRRKSRVGVLIGIPLLLFICGITLVSIGVYNYAKYAFYLSRIFLHEDVQFQASNIKINSSEKTNSASNENKLTFPTLGQEYGELIIESASIKYPVYFGDREEELLKGIGHYNGSRFPGENGNVVLAGHRNSVFKNLKKAVKGDTIVFNATYGKYVYKIVDIKIVKGNDKSIVKPSDTEKLTIYTCYPFEYIGNAPQRYVVTADLVEGTPVKELMEKAGAGN